MNKKQRKEQQPREAPRTAPPSKSAPASSTAGPLRGAGGSSTRTPAANTTTSSTTTTTQQQQQLLDAFRLAFGGALRSPSFAARLQGLKGALYERDFGRAFAAAADPAALDVYAARWSPTRALGYAAALEGVGRRLDEVIVGVAAEDIRAREAAAGSGGPDGAGGEEAADGVTQHRRRLRVLCLGGGAAELGAFASLAAAAGLSVSLTLVDAAPWSGVVGSLEAALSADGGLLLPRGVVGSEEGGRRQGARLETRFVQRDVLAADADDIASWTGGGLEKELGAGRGASAPLLVTLFFTLNELYNSSAAGTAPTTTTSEGSASAAADGTAAASEDAAKGAASSPGPGAGGGGIARTTTLLLRLTSVLAAGSLLLVLDSPGSYSEVRLRGGSARKYPMRWLLEHALLLRGGENEPEEEGGSAGPAWERVESHDSVWFRLDPGLSYPIPLENMRYQMHLYRRLDGGRR